MSTPSIIIIGAGFAGLGMALELRRAGLENFTILERAADLGGVWRENTYPGAACDVPSPLYSWSAEPKSDWPRRFSEQRDIHDYMRGVARKHDLARYIRFGTEVTDAEFDEGTGRWRVSTADGAQLDADILIPAVGQLSRPALPNLPGIDTFTGVAFHSAEWNHDVDLTGKRVACIGTGASAIQYIPRIQPKVEHLTLFQRSAAWVLPKPDVEYSALHHAMFKYFPPSRWAERFAIWSFFEVLALALTDIPAIKSPVIALADRHREKQVPDPELRAKLTPDYAAGCKRGLFSNEYFPALAQPNVTVETTAIEAVTPTGIRTVDGVEHPVDVIVYGTGFKGTEFLAPMNIYGLGGRKLADVWGDAGARAYLGLSVPNFPNLFMMYGPNTNVGSGSIIYMLESQARYIRQVVEYLAEHPGRFLAARANVEQQWDDWLQRRLKDTPWNFCSSWYRNAAGRITNNWPGATVLYRWKTRTFDPSDYDEARVGV
ncbi:Predicted flavoprotein CzcO associated with the cation diffusion facilitator CzcD [Nocardia amikacinitolerans]|uniref:Predicted flavoprotein CzcO associated with the cation diffusion facilitator CzcD n=1 Tax=Nocardia amikacinitolerans TaxID=756689 RepID=A0A285LSG1_9NOCA|nr:NAD(P)/FAD-dependent oxidoreductase [Nocardia amikacinitolerans]MCP2295708.1 putative flavoprotein CzcO associated with the cation diffusion facilitator CzcD [Nocardia amikacinitolerans]SNY87849.1 Predicted flavoprotein CzcO associated with the cation diffusion facilitator CzcD [Nocardia amikacinitolerans]